MLRLAGVPLVDPRNVTKCFSLKYKNNFCSPDVNVISEAYLPPSASLDLVLEDSSLCTILSRTRMLSASET